MSQVYVFKVVIEKKLTKKIKSYYIQKTLEIVDLDIVDSLVLVDKIVLTIYNFMK